MCGRFTLRKPARQMLMHFGIDEPPAVAARFNVAPTQTIAVVRANAAGGRELVALRWGLVPSWAQDPSIGSRMINARSETLADKPSFRNALRQRRCLILSDGFYEWKKVGRAKQPYLIAMPGDEPFAFAGLWERWGGVDPALETCTIITTAAIEVLRPLHERMPVIVDPADYDAWLDPARRDPAELMPLLTGRPNERLQMRPVSLYVNSAANEGEECVRPVDTAAI